MEFEKYDTERDRDQLLDICKDVWGGTDYLPTILDEFTTDSRCYSFVIREEIPNQVCGDTINLTIGQTISSFWSFTTRNRYYIQYQIYPNQS